MYTSLQKLKKTKNCIHSVNLKKDFYENDVKHTLPLCSTCFTLCIPYYYLFSVSNRGRANYCFNISHLKKNSHVSLIILN